MSADPVTMMIISSAVQIGGAYRDIQDSKNSKWNRTRRIWIKNESS